MIEFLVLGRVIVPREWTDFDAVARSQATGPSPNVVTHNPKIEHRISGVCWQRSAVAHLAEFDRFVR